MAARSLRLLPVVALLATTATVSAQSQSGRAADVNGEAIDIAEVDAKIASSLAKLHDQIYRLRQKQLETMIDQKLLAAEAAKRDMTIAALVRLEVTSRVVPVTDEETGKFYEANKAKLSGDYASLADQIKKFLSTQRLQQRQQEFLKSLRQGAKVNVLLTAPPVVREQVVIADAPVLGAGDAPVTIVEFSDFHCPFCRKVQPVLKQVQVKYGDKVKMVFRDLPLDSLHPQARAVAEAARCANEQGKFWEFHDRVFANGSDGSPDVLDGYAKDVGMNVGAFAVCRTSGKYRAAVQASAQEGARLGITGTPTFYINGRMLTGAQSLEAFSTIIDEELQAAASARPVAQR